VVCSSWVHNSIERCLPSFFNAKRGLDSERGENGLLHRVCRGQQFLDCTPQLSTHQRVHRLLVQQAVGLGYPFASVVDDAIHTPQECHMHVIVRIKTLTGQTAIMTTAYQSQ